MRLLEFGAHLGLKGGVCNSNNGVNCPVESKAKFTKTAPLPLPSRTLNHSRRSWLMRASSFQSRCLSLRTIGQLCFCASLRTSTSPKSRSTTLLRIIYLVYPNGHLLARLLFNDAHAHTYTPMHASTTSHMTHFVYAHQGISSVQVPSRPGHLAKSSHHANSDSQAPGSLM